MTTVDVDCTQLPEWVCWIAQDADGTWWGYSCEPNQAEHGWYENEVGATIRLVEKPANPDWRHAILKVNR